MTATTVTCRRCGRIRQPKCRKLCQACYNTVRFDGTLHDYERVKRPLADFADDFGTLSRRGLTHAQVADALGYRPASVERLVCRARRAGLLPSYAGRAS